MKRRILVGVLVAAALLALPVAWVVTSNISDLNAHQLCCYAKPDWVLASDALRGPLFQATRIELIVVLAALAVFWIVSAAKRRTYRGHN